MMKIVCQNCDSENDKSSKFCSVCGYKIINSDNEEINANSGFKNSNPRRKFSIKTIIGFILGFFAMFYITQYFFKESLDIDKEIVNSVNEINKVCPIRVDEYMVLDGALALPNKTIQYNYSLIDFEKSEVNLDTVKKYVFSGVLANIRTNPDMQIQRENKVTFNYYYKDKNGVFVTKYIVTPEMYE